MSTLKMNKDKAKAPLLITGGSGFLGGNLAFLRMVEGLPAQEQKS